MPNWASLVRLLRRRLVLGIIFALSLTYCAISLLAHEKLSPGLRKTNFEDAKNIGEDYENPEEESSKGSGKHLSWQLELENNYEDNNNNNNVEGDNTMQTESNGTLVTVRTCRNSVQGKALIVDERGYVCARSEVLPTGCCTGPIDDHKESETYLDPRQGVNKPRRYSCDTCNPQGCCAIYEYCVSCCLAPGKRRGKKDAKIPEKDRPIVQKPLRRGDDAIKLRLRGLDRFQICLAACRTSSASVRHENTYKDPEAKHCYSHYQKTRRDEQISKNNNNNEDNVKNYDDEEEE